MIKFFLATTLNLALIASMIEVLPAAMPGKTATPTEAVNPNDDVAWGWSRRTRRSGYW
jgi:hypothetical protein